MSPLFRLALEELRAGRSVVSVVIYSHKGSTPRTAGARLLVRATGTATAAEGTATAAEGTVGGGRCEAEALAAAQELLALPLDAEPPARLLEYSLHGVTDMDMICGGELSLALLRLDPDAETIALCEKAAKAEEAGQAFCLVSRLSTEQATGQAPGQAPGQDGRCRILGREITIGSPAAPSDILPDASPGTPRMLRRSDGPALVEPFPQRRGLFLFGAGHVSLALANLAHTLGYHVTVLEDRADFASAERFPLARRLVLADQKTATLAAGLAGLTPLPGPDDAAVILTRGHAADRDALEAALGFPFGYIGMIGSKAKREAVYAQLREKGVAGGLLAGVRSPVGLAIGAQTPEEIAVSIAAELIALRNKRA